MTAADDRVISFPCEGCGEEVVFPTAGDTEIADRAWGDEQLVVWCLDCWRRT